MYQPIPTPAPRSHVPDPSSQFPVPRSQIPVPDPYNRDLMVRAPLWLILLLILAIVGLGVYGCFTTPLPFGLSSVIQTPGGGLAAPSTSTRSTPAGTRTVAGQPLVLGATNVVVQ